MSTARPDAVQRIPRLPRRGSDALAFDALREAGIELAQQASGQLWTDYNLHDPGVTLLESLAYALTEDVYASSRTVPELLGLAEPISEQALARHALLVQGQVLPCQPCTADDQLRWLHDCLPGTAHLGMDGDAQTGLWQISMLSPEATASEACAAAASAYWRQRNLGEDLQGWPQLLEPRWLQLELSISVQGSRDLVDLLGELLLRCEDFIMARPAQRPAAALPTQENEDLDGPRHGQGPLDPAELRRMRADMLYVSDLARALQGIEGLAAVHALALREPELPPGGAAPETLPRREQGRALALLWPHRPAELSGWRVRRHGAAVLLPEQALLTHLADLQRASRHLRLPPPAAAAAPPQAPPRDSDAYLAASAQLPLIYQHPELLRWHSDRAAAAMPGQTRQWLGYLALLELPLAQLQAQREQLGELYALNGDVAHSYWWHLPLEQEMPGLATLYREGPGPLLQSLSADDPALERRGRVLDHLLALHGEALEHHGLQGLPCYLGAQDWALHLHALKRSLAERVQRHTEQRHTGIDYSRASFEQRDNTAPLQERLSLQLGFAHAHSRSLARPLRESGLHLAPERRPGGTDGVDRMLAMRERPQRPSRALAPPQPSTAGMALAAGAEGWKALARDITPLHGGIEPALLRSAVHWERFRLEGAAQRFALTLGPDESRRHWELAEDLTPAAAQDLALRLHHAACGLQFEAEGLHLVEHQLLRPWQSNDPDPFYRHRLSLVFPAWTARCASKRFRRLAQELVRQAAPAHLHCRLLWLRPEQMHDFELRYQSWLIAKQSHCRALLTRADDRAQRTSHLDRRAAALAELLRQAGA